MTRLPLILIVTGVTIITCFLMYLTTAMDALDGELG